jgi:hypothetical protein
VADAWFSQFASGFVPERSTLATTLILFQYYDLWTAPIEYPRLNVSA